MDAPPHSHVGSPAPRHIGRRITLVSPSDRETSGGDVVLVLDRGAFGSGEHGTTRSCLEEMEALPGLGGASVLDLGSGTGVLAIAALKLGAARAVCVDIDAKAVETARRNARLNEVDDRVRHVLGTLAEAPRERYDLVLANLYADVLLPLAEPLVQRVKAAGVLLLSGVAWEYAWDVRSRYETLGCVTRRVLMLEEYCTMRLEVAGGRAAG